MKNKIAIAIISAIASFAFVASFVAAETSVTPNTGGTAVQSVTKMMVNINSAGRARLNGTIASVGSTSLTVNSWGGVWAINVAPDTKLIRRFGGSSSLGEFQQGDSVVVTGTVNQNSSWTIDAKNVQNKSIQERNAIFYGTISNLNGNNFTFATKVRGNVNVTVNADAKIRVNGKSGSVSDLANGMMGSISGVWDRTQSTVQANRVVVRTPKTATSSAAY